MDLAFLTLLVHYALKTVCMTSFALCFSWIWQRRHFYKFGLKVPTFWGLPIFGILPYIGHVNNFLPIIGKYFKVKKSNNIFVWMGVHPTIFTQDVEFINAMLSNPKFFEKSKIFYKPLLEVFGDSLVLSSFEKWLLTRGSITANFKRTELLSFFSVFNEARKLALTKLGSIADGKPHKLSTLTHQMILNITLNTTLGLKLADDKITTKIIKNFTALSEIMEVQLFAGYFNLERLSLWYGRQKYKDFFKLSKDLVELSILDIKGSLIIEEKPKLFIERLIESFMEKKLSWEDVMSESVAILVASFETVANTIVAALALLATHPDAQTKLYDQLKQEIPDPNSDVNYEVLNRLPYLDQVIKEVLRLNPSFPFIVRQVSKGTLIEEYPIELPKDLQIMISIYHLHRRTDIWGADAESFVPERFVNKNVTATQSRAYMPFSKGSRNCIGWRYAQFSLKVLLAGFIRNFEFITDVKFEDLKVVDHVTLKYINEPNFVIRRRNS